MKTKMNSLHKRHFLWLLFLALITGCLAQFPSIPSSNEKEPSASNNRQNPQLKVTNSSQVLKNAGAPPATNKQRQTSVRKAPQRGNNGTQQVVCEKDLSIAIDKCARPLMDIIEGRLKYWPKVEKDAIELCNQFATAEKCIKDVSRRCAKGIQKSICSTFANSVQRARKGVCMKDKYSKILDLTKCVERHQDELQILIGNITNRLTMIDEQFKDPSKKVNGLCCMIKSSELEIKQLFQPKCADETGLLIRIYRTVLEDVSVLICRQAKCDDIFKGLKSSNKRLQNPKYEVGLVVTILRILDSLS